VNNCLIPSTHAERQITDLSVKHLFTLYPSLSPYRQTEPLLTKERIHLLRMGWMNFFPVVVLCQFFVLAGNRFWFYILVYLGIVYTQKKNFRVGKTLDFPDPIFDQRPIKTPKLGLAVIRARGEKSS
jgi:hypothetical protein